MLDNLFILLGVRKELKRNSSVVNRSRRHWWYPHVETVDSGPKVIHVVWMEQVDLNHTSTCMGLIVEKEDESMRQRCASRCDNDTQTKVALRQRLGESCVSFDGQA